MSESKDYWHELRRLQGQSFAVSQSGFSSPEFAVWHRRAQEVLAAALPFDDSLLRDFQSIRFQVTHEEVAAWIEARRTDIWRMANPPERRRDPKWLQQAPPEVQKMFKDAVKENEASLPEKAVAAMEVARMLVANPHLLTQMAEHAQNKAFERAMENAAEILTAAYVSLRGRRDQ